MDKYTERPLNSRYIRSAEWWQAQALKVGGGKCLKCRGLTKGVYVPPSTETEFECAVMESCRLCGWDTVVVTGRVNEATIHHARPTTHIKVVGSPKARRFPIRLSRGAEK